MKVDTLRSTPKPEKLVAQTARGDYDDGYVVDAEFAELMGSVEHDDRHVEMAIEHGPHTRQNLDSDIELNEGGPVWVDTKIAALLERLFRRGHWGPFEHPQITLAVEGISRSCMAQLTRHRHVSFDVQSMRYVDFSEKDDPIKVPKSLLDDQHFSRETGTVELDGIDADYARESYENTATELVEWYENMVEHGLPKEDARFLLPIGTKVNLTMSMNARMLLHIEDMRKTGESQWEIRELTREVHDKFTNWMPMTAYLYEEHGPHKLAP